MMDGKSSIQSIPYPYMAFSTVNRRVEPYLMKDHELWDSVNFWTERRVGAKKARPGLTPFLNQVDSNAVRGLFYVKFPNGNQRVARISGDKVYAVDPNVAANWGTAKATLTASLLRPEYTVLAGKAHIVSRVSSSQFFYIEWDNTDTFTTTNYTSGSDPVVPSKAATIVQYHRRIYVGDVYDGTNEFSSMLGWCSIDYLNKGTSPASPWTTQTTLVDSTFASSRHIDRDYKGAILKLTNINDRLNIYKEEGIYRYNETQVFELFGLSPIQGSIATMSDTKEDYFFTNEGFFKTDGKDVKPIGEGWYDIIKQIIQNGIDPTKIHSFAQNFMYFCYLGNVTYDGQTLANACFVYSSYYDELYLWSFGYDITCFGYYVATGKEKVILLGDINGNTYKLDYNASDDAGIPIFGYFITKYFFFDSPHLQNGLKELHAFALPGSEIEVAVSKNFEDEFDTKADISEDFEVKKIDPNKIGQAKCIAFKFMWNGKGKRPEVWGIIPVVTQNPELAPGKQ